MVGQGPLFNYELRITNYELFGHPDGTGTPEFAISLVNQLKNAKLFQLRYQRDDVYLFFKKSGANSQRVFITT